MAHTLYLVTGAPGVGKSTTLAAFLHLHSRFLALDLDWFLDAASTLAGKEIRFAPTTWPAYHTLWVEILAAIDRNHRETILFAPISPQDITQYGQPYWCTRIEWLLLDCDDEVRRQRLSQRPDWTTQMIEEALHDARELRQSIEKRIDTGRHTPTQVAQRIHEWTEEINSLNDEANG